MANSIIMPKTGMAMEEGVIIEWRVKQGDTVARGDVVALIETDKSTMELESDYDGVILAVLGGVGETVPVTTVIAWVGQPGEAVPSGASAGTSGSPAVTAGASGVITGSPDVIAGTSGAMTGSHDVIAGTSSVMTGTPGAMTETSGVIAGTPGAITGSPDAMMGTSSVIAGELGAIAGASGVITGEPGAMTGELGAIAGASGVIAGEPGAMTGTHTDAAQSVATRTPKATPAARALAAERGIPLSSVAPGGKHGEIRRADIAASMPIQNAKHSGQSPRGQHPCCPAEAVSGARGGTEAAQGTHDQNTQYSGSLRMTTPLARRMAEGEGISLAGVRGSGQGGKIFSADLAQIGGTEAAQSVTDQNPRDSGSARTPQDRRVPLTTIQKITGKRLSESRRTIPEVTAQIRADVTRLLDIRRELNASLATAQSAAGSTRMSKITINDFVLAAVVKALLANPRLNSTLDGGELVYRGDVNLGMAVATERGLVVPAIHKAQDYSLAGLAGRAAELAARAREGRLSPEEMSGGTFTVSNIGMYGITAFTPIINPPEAAILGVCAVEDELKLEGERVVNRKKMGLSLAYDHRIVDGAESSVFLKDLKDILEAPLLLLL